MYELNKNLINEVTEKKQKIQRCNGDDLQSFKKQIKKN